MKKAILLTIVIVITYISLNLLLDLTNYEFDLIIPEFLRVIILVVGIITAIYIYRKKLKL